MAAVDGGLCSDHPFTSTSPGGGICAFCLQEKLGKLVSSSSTSFFIASSSSSSPSFRSDNPSSTSTTAAISTTTGISSNVIVGGGNNLSRFHHHHHHHHSNNNNKSTRERGVQRTYQHHQQHKTTNNNTNSSSSSRARLPFLLTQKKKKKSPAAVSSSSSATTTTATTSEACPMILKRSKSISTPRSTRFLNTDYSQDFSPRRRGFWSFLHLPTTAHKKPDKSTTITSTVAETTAAEPQTVAATTVVVVDETDESPNSSGSNTASFGRIVSRSRSVGCGSRSFSGDFFERISTGFGDCTLRRVESQREGGTKHRHSTSRIAGDTIREKVRCGGLFGGFMITSSSSSTTSSSSSYWANDGRPSGPTATPGTGPLVHGRSRSWGWAFASPMRAFGKPTITTTMKDGKREFGGGSGTDGSNTKNSNGTPNLAAIPSLLAVRG